MKVTAAPLGLKVSVVLLWGEELLCSDSLEEWLPTETSDWLQRGLYGFKKELYTKPLVTTERERNGAQIRAQGDQRRGLTASTKGREQPPTSIVYEPAILAAHGVLLLDNTHDVSFQQ